MIISINIKFVENERERIRAAAAHLGIVYDTVDEDGRRAPEWRAVNAAAEGAPLGHDALQRALTGLRLLQERCAQEARYEYWTDQLVSVAQTDIRRVPPSKIRGEVPLVADPHEMCRVLAEARTQQFVHATAAVNLLKAALRECPEPRVEQRLRDLA